MRVTLLVGGMMMLAMQRDPDYRRILHAADAQNGEQALHPSRGRKAAMRQQAMVPDVNAERAEDVASQKRNHDPAPAKEPGQARENRNKMDENDRQGISPFDAP